MANILAFKRPLARARTCSQFLRNRPALLTELLKHFSKLPVKFGKTRFAIHLLLAERFSEMEDACTRVVNSETWRRWYKTQKKAGKKAGDAFRRRVLRPNFWAGLRLVTAAMEPVLRLLRSVDGTKAGLSGKYMVRLSEMEEQVQAAMRHFRDGVSSEVMSIIRERRQESHNRLYGVAFCLDPEFVGQDPVALLGSEWAEQAQQDWTDYVESLPDSGNDLIPQLGEGIPQKLRGDVKMLS
eukprot:GHVU01067114.1.p1 GENE.GHVU01067114.1~~GHVU01067114.1.p1  ORF type:complete len:240 (+),score=24.44 GHVU01067114.1:1105-1824(+)